MIFYLISLLVSLQLNDTSNCPWDTQRCFCIPVFRILYSVPNIQIHHSQLSENKTSKHATICRRSFPFTEVKKQSTSWKFCTAHGWLKTETAFLNLKTRQCLKCLNETVIMFKRWKDHISPLQILCKDPPGLVEPLLTMAQAVINSTVISETKAPKQGRVCRVCRDFLSHSQLARCFLSRQSALPGNLINRVSAQWNPRVEGSGALPPTLNHRESHSLNSFPSV